MQAQSCCGWWDGILPLIENTCRVLEDDQIVQFWWTVAVTVTGIGKMCLLNRRYPQSLNIPIEQSRSSWGFSA